MISQSPEDRQFYEARLRYLQNEEARLNAACEAARDEGREEGREEGWEEGREEGAAQGTLIGKIQILQELVGDSVTGTPELLPCTSQQLTQLLSALQQRLRSRGD